jgi:hypothetical protein
VLLQVEAEKLEDLAERYGVAAVPHYSLIKVCERKNQQGAQKCLC